MFEQDPAVAVDDRLGHARRARRVQHVQRMVGGDLLELERARFGDEVAPWDRAGHRLITEVRQCQPCALRLGRPSRIELHLDRGDRCRGCRTGSRRRPGAPSDRSGRTDRAPPAHRTPAHNSTRSRRGWRWRGRRRSSPARWAGRPRPGRRADAQPLQTGACAADLIGERRPRQRRRPSGLRVRNDRRAVDRRAAGCARRSSAWRRPTIERPASTGESRMAVIRHAGSRSRRTPRSPPRSRRCR